MKSVLKFTLCVMLAVVLVMSIAACQKEEPSATEETKKMVAATQPDYSDETTGPVYTRPSDDEEGEQENTPTTNDKGDSENEEVELHPDEQGGNTTNPNDGDNNSTGNTGGESADDGEGFSGDDVEITDPKGDATWLSWSGLNSFPTKSSSMSVSQMRKLCVDFLRYCKTALWTPSQSIDFIKNAKGAEDSMTGGKNYGGLPYVGLSSGNMYRLMDYLNTSTHKVDMADALNLTGDRLDMPALRYFGNQCANGAFQGWNRVINSVSATHTAGITVAKGYIKLGDYEYDTAKVKTWSEKYGTDEVCKANGEQVMYASYAKLVMGDGLVYYTTAGHVIMAATDAHVEYIPGTTLIDGNKSYITIIDQAQSWVSYTTGAGVSYQVKSNVDAKVTFRKLYSAHYLPFTFKEFTGADKVESTDVKFSYAGASAKLSDLYKATVTCNYAVSDAYIIVTDASGKEVYKHAVRNSSSWGKTLKMASSGANVDAWGTVPTSGSYTVKVVAQLGTGERPTLYTGTLAF